MTNCFKCGQPFENQKLFVWYGPPKEIRRDPDGEGGLFQSERLPVCGACRRELLNDPNAPLEPR